MSKICKKRHSICSMYGPRTWATYVVYIARADLIIIIYVVNITFNKVGAPLY